MRKISTNHRLVLMYMNLAHNVFNSVDQPVFINRHIVGGRHVNIRVLPVEINLLARKLFFFFLILVNPVYKM